MADLVLSDLDDIIAQFQAGDFQARWEMVKVFPGFGPSAIAPLVALLTDPGSDEELQWFIAQILGKFNHPDAIVALTQLLQSVTDEDLCHMAAQTLAQVGPEAIDALTPLLADATTRLAAVNGLAQIGHPQTIPALTQVVCDPQVEVRVAALSALANFHRTDIAALLIQGLQDPSPLVRQIAVTGLSFQTQVPVGRDRVSQLAPLLADPDLAVCRATAQACGRIGSERAVTLLAERLHLPATPTALQISIVQALGWSGSQQAIQALGTILLDPCLGKRIPLELEVFQEVILVLGRVQASEESIQATQILLDVLACNSPVLQHPGIKSAIASALGQLGQPQAMSFLIQLLATSDMGVRLHGIAALKQLSSVDPHQQLRQMAERPDLEPALAEGVAIALQEWSI